MINNNVYEGYVPDNIYPPFTVKFQYNNSSVSSSINSAAALSLEDPVPCKDVSAGLGRRRQRNRKSLSASISGTSVYRGSKRGKRVVRRPRLAKSDCPTTVGGDRGAALTLDRLE